LAILQNVYQQPKFNEKLPVKQLKYVLNGGNYVLKGGGLE